MIEKLIETTYEKNCPNDLEQKWTEWLEELDKIPNFVEIVREEVVEYGKIIDFTFLSVNNVKVYSRLHFNNSDNNYPLIVYYHGSMSNMEQEWVKNDCNFWFKEGFSIVMFDARNQGGHTIDDNEFSYKDSNYLNQGIDKLETNYNRRLYLDGVKLVNICKDENVELFKEISKKELIVLGGSQGGEMSLAVASLSDKISLCIPDIPSGCAIKERIIHHYGKYTAIENLKQEYPEFDIEKAYSDMGYFDIINLVHKIECPVFASVGNNDLICPPGYFYKAYELIKTKKTLYIYSGYGHGGFDHLHRPKKLKYIKEYFNLNNLVFVKSVFKERIWGSHYFKEVLNYALDDNLYGEMWSISAHKEGLCEVINGPYKGYTLDKLYAEQKELFGTTDEEFPLMVKLIHTNDDLSVQVHPDDEYAKNIENQFGKTECWYFVNEPENPIVLGHNASSKKDIKEAINAGILTDLLKKVEVKKDDFAFIPSKTVHALTSGLLVVEIQQSSDVTYRLYDYNRKDKNGNLRQLHVDKALDVIDVPDTYNYPVKNYSHKTNLEKILDSNLFSCILLDVEDNYDLELYNDKFVIVTVISGTLNVAGNKLNVGESFICLVGTKILKLTGTCRIIISKPE